MLHQLVRLGQSKAVQATTAFAATSVASYSYFSSPTKVSSFPAPSAFSSIRSIHSMLPQASAQTQQNEFGELSSERFKKFRLLSIDPVSPDSAIYYFQVGDQSSNIQLPVASYVLARAEVNMEGVVRPYTPLGSQIPGELPLLVKTYPDGKMGRVFATLQPGDELELKGPLTKFDYIPNRFHRLTMVAGGSGLTPMFQLIDAIINNKNDHTKVNLLYANKSQEDILLKPVLDDISGMFPEQFKITYVIDKPEAGWKGPTGFITKELLLAVAGPANSKDSHQVLICGPPAMVDAIAGPKGPNYTQGELSGILKELNYSSDNVYKY